MMMRRGLGDSPDDYTPAVDYGQVATWGWYGVALMLAVVYLGPLVFARKKGRKRRK